MSENIIVGIIMSIVLIGLAIWLKKNIQPSEVKISEEMTKELKEKSDIAAQVPLLQLTIDELIIEKETQMGHNAESKKELTKKDILIAEANKNIEELQKDLREQLFNYIKKAREEKENLDIELEEKKNEIIKLHSIVEKKEYEILKVKTAKEMETEIATEKISLFTESLDKTKTELAESNIKSEKLFEIHNEIKREKTKFEADQEALNKVLKKLEEDIEIKNNDIHMYKKQYKEIIETNSIIQSEKSTLEANIAAQEKNNAKLKEDFEEQGKKLALKLGEIIQQALDSKIKKFDDTSVKGLTELLKPSRENPDTFKNKIEEKQESSVEKLASLSKEIEDVTKMEMSTGKEAENLTQALKGKKQTQGSWGEMILEDEEVYWNTLD